MIAFVQQLKKSIPVCESVDPKQMDWNNFNNIVETLESPAKHMQVIGKDVVLNGRAITSDLGSALDAWRFGNYVEFGEKLGTVMTLATEPQVPEELTLPAAAQIGRKEVTEVAQGLLDGTLVGHFDFTALLFCIYEADQAALILYEGVNILEEAYADKDVSEAIGGVIAMIAFLQQLKKSIPVCESVDPKDFDWSNFNNIVETLESPEKHMQVIGKDVFFNGKMITEDLAIALDAWRSADYLNFGESLGSVLTLATEQTLF